MESSAVMEENWELGESKWIHFEFEETDDTIERLIPGRGGAGRHVRWGLADGGTIRGGDW